MSDEKSFIEILKEYSSDFEQPDLPKDEGKDLELNEVKRDTLLYSDYFIDLFNEFYRVYQNCSEASEIIKKNSVLRNELLKLKTYKSKDITFGRARAIRNLNLFVIQHYQEIEDFVNLCKELG